MNNSLGSLPQIPITIKHGGTFYLPFIYKDSTGTVVNLANYNARMQVYSSQTASGTAIIDIGTYGTNAEQGNIVFNLSTWQVSITIYSSFTETLPNICSKGRYEFHFIDNSNNDIPMFEGQVLFETGGLR